MIKRIKIEPLSKSSSVFLTGAYLDPNTREMIFLDSLKDLYHKSLPEGKRQFSFTIRPKQHYEFTINTDNKSDLAVLSFWEKHPQIKVSGKTNTNLTVPNFQLTDLYDAEAMKNASILSRFEIARKILMMDESELNSLIFALNGDPRFMTDKAVKQNYLIGDDFISGRAMVLSDRFALYVDSPEKDRRVHTYIFKAIRLGIIPTVDNMYTFGGKTLGAVPERVIDYFMSDQELFENVIVPEVDAKDTSEGNKKPLNKRVATK